MFRRRARSADAGDPASRPADVFLGLRQRVFSLDPADVDLDAPLWGCVMETGYPEGTATLVCLADGTTSLYTSSGFGIIGGGGHESVVRANRELLRLLGQHLAQMALSSDQSLPSRGTTIIRALTRTGQRTFEDFETGLGEGRSPMSPVFHSAHAVITQLRLIDEASR
jgi:hypothetical protein